MFPVLRKPNYFPANFLDSLFFFLNLELNSVVSHMYQNVIVHPSVDEHLRWFHFPAILNRASINKWGRCEVLCDQFPAFNDFKFQEVGP